MFVLIPTEVRGMAKRILNDVTMNEWVAAYTGGESIMEIARRAKVKTTRVSDALHARGVRIRPNAPHRFGSDIERQIAERYASGETLSQLADTYGCCKEVVANCCRWHGVPTRRIGGTGRQFTPEEIGQIREWVAAGLSQHEISRRLRTHQTIVSKVCSQNRITITKVRPTDYRGEAHPNWKGGRRVDDNGYVHVWIPADHAYAAMRPRSGYILEHRLKMAELLGRPLTSRETVHHVDGNKQENDPSNLQLRSGRHGKGAAYVCADCGSHNVIAVPLGASES